MMQTRIKAMSSLKQQEFAGKTIVAFKFRTVVLTLGHSKRTLAEFLALITAHAVTPLVDFRIVPRPRPILSLPAILFPEHLVAPQSDTCTYRAAVAFVPLALFAKCGLA